jgi:NAD(P)H-hydrate epimerase
MAKGGSGDVLSGIIGALLAQGYPPEDAARLGVYLHGRAGDISKNKQSLISVVASDIIECIGEAYREIMK